MIKSYTSSGNTSLKAMWYEIVSNMLDAGFELVVAYPDNGSGVPNLGSPQTSANNQCLIYLLKPAVSLDPHAETDPWNIHIDLRETHYSINLVTPNQVIFSSGLDNLRIAKTGENTEAGRLSLNNTLNEEDSKFFSRSMDNPTWETCFAGNPDANLVPIGYHLAVTERGIAFYSWAESFDRSGDCHNWFVVQRGINKDGTTDTSNHRPVYCMFSFDGGGGGIGSDINALRPDGILQFVVREADVNMPTAPRSAVVPTADTPMLINPIQQTSTTEDGKFIISMPEGMCTMRNKYDTQLDMIAYTSADVIAQSEEISHVVFGEAESRSYKAMNANFSNNKGMRIFMLTQ